MTSPEPQTTLLTPAQVVRLSDVARFGAVEAHAFDDALVEMGWLVRDGKKAKARIDPETNKAAFLDAEGKVSRDLMASPASSPPAESTPFEVCTILVGLVLVGLLVWDAVLLFRASDIDPKPALAGVVQNMAYKVIAESIAAKLVYLMALVGLSKLVRQRAAK